MSQKVQAASPRDAAAIAPLVEQYWHFEKIPGFSRSRVESLLSTTLSDARRLRGWIAMSEGNVVGYLLCTFIFSLEHGGTVAEIDELFVEPQSRSLGLGQSLLDAAQDALLQEGIRVLHLQLGTSNRDGRRFYERNSFAEQAAYVLLQKSLA
jgi:ribosomal protein S18 acetylase RimI-like enzyme